ncbi:MAG: dethiobiotin synthase [Candidatus Cyclobacteriaceae bacterium M2_1C_046]
MQNIFVTAIGTDSGKTVVSAILAKSWGYDYWKPVQSGKPTDSETIRKITGGTVKIHPEKYFLQTPASPHHAAEVESKRIKLTDFEIPQSERPLIIEGAGGLMVPLNEEHLMIDLIKKFNCQVVLVSNIYLGSINHTLLSLEALNNRGIEVNHLVFNGPPTPSTENIIQNYFKAPVLFRLDPEDKIDAETIDRYAKKISRR